MKNLFVLVMALVFGAVSAQAQSQTYPNHDVPACVGNLCSGDTVTVTVFGGVTRAGTAGAVFDAGPHGIGDAGATTNGREAVDISMYINTCEAGCENNRVEATVMGRQASHSYAWGRSDRSGQPVVASTLGTAAVVADFGAGFNACPNGCPAPNPGASQPD